MKHWYKVETNKGGEGIYHYIGSSVFSSEEIAAKAQKGELVRLDELLYMERGEMKEWANWDKSLEPSVLINPTCILSIMEFKGILVSCRANDLFNLGDGRARTRGQVLQ